MQVGKVDGCSDRGGRLVLLVSKIVMLCQDRNIGNVDWS